MTKGFFSSSKIQSKQKLGNSALCGKIKGGKFVYVTVLGKLEEKE